MAHAYERDDPVMRWLLGSDPGIRWQALRDLTDAPEGAVAAERTRVATEGWGARLLAGRSVEGAWGAGTENPEWATLRALLTLRDLGLDPASGEARSVVAAVREHVTWRGVLPQDAAWHGKPLFAGEVEPCINGRVVAVGAYFGEDVRGIVDRLLGEQMADGGWNCEQERGSARGSFHTTICVLEGLLQSERSAGVTADATAARERGHEYLLERRLLRRLSTGEVIDPAWSRFSFPPGWHYDALRALDYLRSAGVAPDGRVAEAVGIVESRRGEDGRWALDTLPRNEPQGEPDAAEGAPSRWITLRARRVLAWAAREA